MNTIPETEKYIPAIGRRKTSVASVRIYPKTKSRAFIVNNKDVFTYFPTEELQILATEALAKKKEGGAYSVSAVIHGGGIHSQAEALRHGIARALVDIDIEVRKDLKKAGFLKRDPRKKERKKFGLKKARRAPQWKKR